MRVIFISEPPTGNTGFGRQGNALAAMLTRMGHDVHYISIGTVGAKFVHNGYCVYADRRSTSKGIVSTIREITADVDPSVIVTFIDIQDNAGTVGSYHRNSMWVAWTPLDIDEASPEAKRLVSMPDINVFCHKRGHENAGRESDVEIPCTISDIYKPGPVDPATTKLLGFKENDFVLGFVGRPSWRKNLPVIFSTMNELVNVRGHKNIKLLVHSALDDPAASANYQQWTVALGLIDNVIFTSSHAWDTGIDDEDLANLYRSMDVYFAPHGGEGFGIPMAEAMACGVPLVATIYTASADMIGNNERGIGLRCGNMVKLAGVMRPMPHVKECADAIEVYYKDKNLRKKHGHAAAAFVNDNYRESVVYGRWKELMQKVGFERVRTNAI